MSEELDIDHNKAQTVSTHVARVAGEASVAGAGEERRTEIIEGLPVELAPDSRVIRLESGAVGVTNAVMGGFWHISTGEIAAFTDDRATGAVSNLGPGTYVGHGALTGDKLKGLHDGAHVKHNLQLQGNILVVPLEAQDDTSWELAELALGDDLGDIGRMAASKRTNKLLREHDLNGEKFDGFVYVRQAYTADQEHSRTADGVIFYSGRVIQIVDRELITPTPESAV